MNQKKLHNLVNQKNPLHESKEIYLLLYYKLLNQKKCSNQLHNLMNQKIPLCESIMIYLRNNAQTVNNVKKILTSYLLIKDDKKKYTHTYKPEQNEW